MSVAIAWGTVRSIVGPTTAMTAAMTRLAEGDNTVDVPARDRSDEIGEMAQSVQVFKDYAVEKERLDAEKAREQE